MRGPGDENLFDFTGAVAFASLYNTRDIAQATVLNIATDAFRRCLAVGFGEGETGTPPPVDVTTLSFPNLGDRTTASRAKATITGGPVGGDFYVDVIFVAKGRTVSGLVVFRVFAPPDTAVAQQVLTNQLARAADVK